MSRARGRARCRRERLAREQAATALEEKAALEARAQGALTRVDTLSEKVRVTRDARLQAQQVLEQRETELREARAEILALQSHLASAADLQRQMVVPVR